MTQTPAKTIGIFLFEEAEELDFVGPFEVFTMARMSQQMRGEPGYDVKLISQSGGEVVGAKGMRFTVDCAMADAPDLDLVLVPGGQGTRSLVENAAVLDWLARVAGKAEWVTSVCTGSYVLAAAGLAENKRVTTHWAFIEELRERVKTTTVLENVRYVRDGNLVTSAGVSAGIDMALWLVGQMESPEFAREVQKYMEYDPAPPYAALV